MSTPALQCYAGSGKGEVALFKLNDVIFGATAGDAFEVGSLGVHQPRGMRVAEFIGENGRELRAIGSQSGRGTLVIRGTHGSKAGIIRGLERAACKQYKKGEQSRFHGSGTLLKSLNRCKSFHAVVPGDLGVHGGVHSGTAPDFSLAPGGTSGE